MENTNNNLQSIDSYEFKGTGLSTSEKRKAQLRFDEYKKKHHITTYSALPLLEELVYRELIQERYKKQVKKLQKSKTVKDTNLIPEHILKAMDDNLKQILTLQDKLGFFSKTEEKDFYRFFKILDNKFKKHREENADEYLLPCPFCKKEFGLKIRTTNYESFITPFFADGKILANKPLFDLYKKSKLTKEEVAKVLGTSTDYIDFLDKYYRQHPSQ